MGDNGIVKENAWKNVDKEKFDKNHAKIFGERERLDCKHCNLSSRQKQKTMEMGNEKERN